jgi:hypothetical protein
MGANAIGAILLMQGLLMGLPKSSSRDSAELRAKLQSPVHDYSIAADTFVDALVGVAGEFKLPMGIVWVRRPSALKAVRLSWHDATVEQVVRDIVHTQPGYEIEIRNAVVRVRPRNMIPDKENFLGLRVDRFDAQSEVTELASKRLQTLVTPRVTPPKPPPAGQPFGIGFEQAVEVGDPEISISLANVTVEDALDAISLASPFKVWLVTFEADKSLTPGGFRRTVLASGKAVADEYQPVWELLKWGRKPY